MLAEMPGTQKEVLHVGCGGYAPGKLHPIFQGPSWRELRLDIDPDARPDIVSSMTEMDSVASSSVDAIFSSHNVEHLYPHEVDLALREFRRVLKPSGFALITLPDLQEIARLVAEGRLDDTAYHSPLGPITPLDMLYGFRPALASGNAFMGHRTGFTGQTLVSALIRTGFAAAAAQRNPANFSLWAVAFPSPPPPERLADIQSRAFPLQAVNFAQPEIALKEA